MTLLSLAGALGGGGSKVSQSVSNASTSLVSLSTVMNMGTGAVSGTTSPATSTQTPSSSVSAGQDSGYPSALPVFDDYTSVPTTPVDTTTYETPALPWGWIAAIGGAVVIGLMFMGKKGK